MRKRKILAFVEIDEDAAERYCETNGISGYAPGSYLEHEFGWLEASGVSLRNWLICDNDDECDMARYATYLAEWIFGLEYDQPPLSYDEWSYLEKNMKGLNL